MKKTRIIILAFAIGILLIVGCTDSTEPDETAKVKGVVKNSLGEPIPDAKIMLSYYTESFSSRPITYFSYNTSSNTKIKFWITHHNISDTIKVLVDEIQEAGFHTVQWDARNSNDLIEVSNVYDWHLKMGARQTHDKFLLNMFYDDITGNEVENYECFATTDDNGKYEFEIGKLPFSFADNEIEVYDNNGNVIDTVRVNRTAKIWAIHSDYDPVFADSVYINAETVTKTDLNFD